MSWDQELRLLLNTGDEEFDRWFELASEWHVKAVSFARLLERKDMDNALWKCNRALRMASQLANATHIQDIDSDAFWDEFAGSGHPGPGTDPNSRNDPSRVPRKPLPSAGSASLALPLPKQEDDEI